MPLSELKIGIWVLLYVFSSPPLGGDENERGKLYQLWETDAIDLGFWGYNR